VPVDKFIQWGLCYRWFMISGGSLPIERVDRLKLALYANEVEALLSVQQRFNSLSEPRTVAQRIAEETRRLASADISAVYLLRKENLEIVEISGLHARFLLGHTVPLESSLAGKALLFSKGYIVNDIRGNSFQFSAAQEKLKGVSFVVVPLVGRNGPIGVVLASSQSPDHFKKEDLLLLELVMPSAAIALENAERFVGAINNTLDKERHRITQKVQAAASQTLFSVLLIVDILPRLVDRDPQQGRVRMEELRDITRKALSEVRNLAMDDH